MYGKLKYKYIYAVYDAFIFKSLNILFLFSFLKKCTW